MPGLMHRLGSTLAFLATGGYRGRPPERFRLILAALGLPLLLAFAGFCGYEVYRAVTAGAVFRTRSIGGTRWVAYADHPVPFLLLVALFSISFIVAALAFVAIVRGLFNERSIRSRALVRTLAGETGPRPIVREPDER